MNNSNIVEQLAKSMHFVGDLHRAPDYAMALSRIVTSWTALEQRFTISYMILTGSSIQTASVTMHSLSNSHQKFTMMRPLAKRFAPTKKFGESLIEIITDAESVARKRSKYVHRQWVVRGDGQVQLINYAEPEGSQRHAEVVQLNHMNEVAERTYKIQKRINDLMLPYLKPSASL